MNDSEYVYMMVKLSRELERVALAEPYDPDAYNSIVDKLNNLPPRYAKGDPRNRKRIKAFIDAFPQKPNRRRRRRPWLALISIIILMIFLLYIVYEILCNLKIMDSQ